MPSAITATPARAHAAGQAATNAPPGLQQQPPPRPEDPYTQLLAQLGHELSMYGATMSPGRRLEYATLIAEIAHARSRVGTPEELSAIELFTLALRAHQLRGASPQGGDLREQLARLVRP